MSERHAEDVNFSTKQIFQSDTADEDSRGEKPQRVVKRKPKRAPGNPSVWAEKFGRVLGNCRARKKK